MTKSNDVNSAEIDVATIDGARIGEVMITVTEAEAATDSLSKSKAVTKNITEAQGNLDIISKFKAAKKTILERSGLSDWSEWIPNFFNGKKYSDYPAIHLIMGLAARVGKTKVGSTLYKVWNLAFNGDTNEDWDE